MTAQSNDVLDAAELKEHVEMFHAMGGGDAFISKKNLQEALTQRGLPTTYCAKIFDRMNAHHDEAQLSLADYITYAHCARLEHLNVFKQISKGRPTISKDELRDGLAVLHLETRHIDVDALFTEMHHSTQGELTFPEFEHYFALLQLEDISYMHYKETYSMFDGGSVSLMRDYRKLLAAVFGASAAPSSSAPMTASSSSSSVPKEYEFYVRMATAGIAGGCAQTCVNPFETIKVRLQNEGLQAVKKYKSFLNGGMVIFAEEGFSGLWKGTSPAIVRELIYTSSRMGCYKPIKDQVHAWKLQAGGKPGPETILEKLLAGGTAGGCAAFVGSPADLIKARMQSDTNALAAKSFAAHVRDILKIHGVAGLWTGASATVARAVVLGSVKMATYDEGKITAPATSRNY